MMWGQHGDNRDNVGTTWGGDNGDHGHGECGDNMGTTGTMWGPHGVETMETMAMGSVMTTWGSCGDDGDDVGMTGMTWGPQGPHGDNEITKNAITLEPIKIIEFHLKIWDP